MGLKLNWDDIVGHAVKTLITGIVVSSMVIVWRGATTVQDKINVSAQKLAVSIEAARLHGEYIKAAVDVISEELAGIKNAQISFSERLKEIEAIPSATKGSFNINVPDFDELEDGSNTGSVMFSVSPPVTERRPNVRQEINVPRDYLQQKLPSMVEWNQLNFKE